MERHFFDPRTGPAGWELSFETLHPFKLMLALSLLDFGALDATIKMGPEPGRVSVKLRSKVKAPVTREDAWLVIDRVSLEAHVNGMEARLVIANALGDE